MNQTTTSISNCTLRRKTFYRVFCKGDCPKICTLLIFLLLLWGIGIIQSYFIGPYFNGPNSIDIAILNGLILMVIYAMILIIIGIIIFVFYIIIINYKIKWEIVKSEIIQEESINFI